MENIFVTEKTPLIAPENSRSQRMFESVLNRRKSYNDILNQLGKQENIVIRCFNMGMNNWYQIQKHTGLNHDSVKRVISNLSTDEVSDKGLKIRNKKKVLIENGSDKNPETGKTITCYRLMTSEELDKFHNNLQETLF